MLDLEQTLKELGSFLKRLTDNKGENIQAIVTRQKEICEDIQKIRKSLNDHLDQLQETLIRSINKTVDDVTLQLGDVKNSLTEIENKISDITLEFSKIKEHASDLQTFLSLPHLISKANDEENNVEKLSSEDKFNRKTIIFNARIDEIIKMKSIGDVGIDDIKCDVAYVKEKEKQAQIIGPLTKDRINLKLLRKIEVKTGNPSNIITGCTILDNGNVLFSEYNEYDYIDRVTLNRSNGHFIRTVQSLDPKGSFYDITSINTNTIAVSVDTCISIVNIDTQNVIQTINNTNRLCVGISHCDDKLYYCSNLEGIRRFDMKTKANQLLVPTTNICKFSYISCDGNRLFYTSSTNTVNCCDMNGKSIWSFEDTSRLRSPRGVVVDKQGFVFVAGEQSGNIVMISPDGNSAKDVYYISSPRAMFYDKDSNQILVCNRDNNAFRLETSLDL
jgi:sugar lactone lactonase YvrE/archaellum component FlaC